MKLRAGRNAVTLAKVAPARERGLKFDNPKAELDADSRSREGAWIEIIDSSSVAVR